MSHQKAHCDSAVPPVTAERASARAVRQRASSGSRLARLRAQNAGMKPPSFSGIPFFVYPVTDMARARAFYGNILGLHETANWEDKWIEYDIGPSTLAITSCMDGAQPGAMRRSTRSVPRARGTSA